MRGPASLTRSLPASVRDADRYRLAAALLAVAAGLVALGMAAFVFPYHSLNHDEGVYLQQAELLLHGQVFLRPPVEDAFRPWFFVEDGDRLYAKYAPVPAAVFALGKLLGGFDLALAGVAAANVGLTYALGRDLYDGRVGVLAAVLLLASPLFLVQSGVFLPYATTTALNLAFAYGYVRAERRGSVRWAAFAGVAVGLAFFARPYTAVLWAAPFVAHAVWTFGCSLRDARDGRAALGSRDSAARRLVTRRLVTGVLGAAGVAVALGYNWYVTGHPLVFPYQAFAPLDGIGFGHRELLGYDVQYTLALGLRANAVVVRTLFTRWVAAGALGTALAAVGVALALRRRADWARLVLAGTYVTVVAGNVAFWGNLNVLGDIAVRTDGLVHYLGPYYHFDLLVPTAIFGAAGLVALATAVRERAGARFDPRRARRVTVAVLLVTAAVLSAAAVGAADGPVARNDRVSQQLAAGYEPFTETGFEDALVFLPAPYGPWLNHPFQVLRNDPGFGGDAVYALDHVHSFRVAETFANRTMYRYVYRGSWVPTDRIPVHAALERVHFRSGDAVAVRTTLGVPEYAERVSIRVATDDGYAYYLVNGTPASLALTIRVEGSRVTVTGPNVTRRGNGTLTVGPDDSVDLTAYVSTGPARGFSYGVELPVDRENGTVRALTPYTEYCTHPRRCGGAAAYLGTAPEGVFVDATFVNATA